VELDTAAGKAQSVKSELAALRRQARQTSTKSAWNKRERQKMHQDTSANTAFVEACNAVKSSYREAESKNREEREAESKDREGREAKSKDREGREAKSKDREAELNPRAFYKDVKALKKLRKEGIYNESEFEAKLQQLKKKHEKASGNEVEQQVKKRKTKPSIEEGSEDEHVIDGGGDVGE